MAATNQPDKIKFHYASQSHVAKQSQAIFRYFKAERENEPKTRRQVAETSRGILFAFSLFH